MTLSLREIVQTRYGITGGFSVIKDVLSKIEPHLANFRTAEGSVSLLLLLTPPIPPVISSFTVSPMRVSEGSMVIITWQVKPPTPWLARNTTGVTVGAWQDAPPNTPPRWWQNQLSLSGELNDIPKSPQTFYYLTAGISVLAGNIQATATVVVQVEPPPPPATIQTFQADSTYFTLGQSTTLRWNVTNAHTDTRVSLQGQEPLLTPQPVLQKNAVPLQGSQSVTPVADTNYTLTVTDSRGTASKTILITIYRPPNLPLGSTFYFKMTNPQSSITPCFTIAMYAKDAATAKTLAEQTNGGYTAKQIDASQFETACGS